MKQRNLGALLVALFIVLATSLHGLARADDAAQQIHRITWIIHPYCWSMAGDTVPANADAACWKACLAWERDNHRKYMEMISRMETDEAVIIYPIGNSRPMQELQEHAKSELGDRCVIIKRSSIDPHFLSGVKDPIRKFLEGSDLPGKS